MIIDLTQTENEWDIKTANTQEQLWNYDRGRRVRNADGKCPDDYNEVLHDLNFVPCRKCLPDFKRPYWGLAIPSLVFSRWKASADPDCDHCFGTGYDREAKNSKKYTSGEPSFRCKCGMIHHFLLPLADEKDEMVYCDCGRYLGYLLQTGGLITEFEPQGESDDD